MAQRRIRGGKLMMGEKSSANTKLHSALQIIYLLKKCKEMKNIKPEILPIRGFQLNYSQNQYYQFAHQLTIKVLVFSNHISEISRTNIHLNVKDLEDKSYHTSEMQYIYDMKNYSFNHSSQKNNLQRCEITCIYFLFIYDSLHQI